MLQSTVYGMLGLFAVALCWALAVVLYRVGAPDSVARKLALLLLVEGITLVSANYLDLALNLPAEFYVQNPLWAPIGFAVHTFGDCAMLALYPPFLAAALQTKLTRPFASKRARIGLAVTAVALFFAVQLSPLEVGAALLYATLSLLFGFALVASINAWRIAPPGIARTRAGTFALAFGFRDICWGFIYGYGIWQISAGLYQLEDAAAPEFFNIVYAGGTLFAIPLIAYGILRTQLFDIDLRIRWTIKQSTLAAVVVAIIFALSEGADRLLTSELGNLGGLVAATLVVFFLAPLQRFAERVASLAMPNTENTPEYATFRKLQVYESAMSEALQEGGISEKERSLLVRLRESLGISESDADSIERELQESVPAIA